MENKHFTQVGYGLTQALINLSPQPVVAKRAPTTADKNFQIGTLWIEGVNTSGTAVNSCWCLTSVINNIATWVHLADNPSGLDQLTADAGVVVLPTPGGNINIVGDGATISVTGNPGTNTLTISNFMDPVTVTGNSGGAVGADPGTDNFNLVGDGVTVMVVGNPGTHTLTISATSGLMTYTAVSTTPYVVLSTDDYLGVNSTGGARTVQLPNTTTTGRVITVKDTAGTAATNNITVTTVGGAVTIDGGTSFVMNTAFESINVIFNGTSYEIF